MENVNINFTKTAKKLNWYMLQYPLSNECYWSFLDDKDNVIIDGNHTIPQATIDKWGTDDSVISNYLLNDARVGR